ncbi:MAG TPA: HD-GYP domain-containing protein [Firmicutes bacterium]|nr:HD-GYP domain-containing protein [Bacillota bacterium]
MAVRTVKTSALIPGMVIGRDILQSSGAYLLQEGTVLTLAVIRKLEKWGIEEVQIVEPNEEQKEVWEAKLRPEMELSHASTVNLMEQVLTNNESLEIEKIRDAVGEIMNQVGLGRDILLNLSHLKSYDNYLFAHSVNVCSLAMIIGEGMGMTPAELEKLGLAAILHDIGMLKVPVEIWKQQRGLTSEELKEIQRHPLYGHDFLTQSGGFSPDVIAGAVQHHERYDGSGYPHGLYGQEIHKYARIIAVADVYDACISPRPHREPMTPREALDNLMIFKEKYDPDVLYTFLSVMAVYPIGSLVQLNTGEIGKVVGIHKNQPFRPELRVYTDRQGKILEKPRRINLDDKNFLLIHIAKTLERAEIAAFLSKFGSGVSAWDI